MSFPASQNRLRRLSPTLTDTRLLARHVASYLWGNAGMALDYGPRTRFFVIGMDVYENGSTDGRTVLALGISSVHRPHKILFISIECFFVRLIGFLFLISIIDTTNQRRGAC
jgi:hypothetical protein